MAGEGGWLAGGAPEHFARYAARVAEHLGGLLSWVCTLNEPNLMAMLSATGVLAMGAGHRELTDEPLEAKSPGVAGFDPSRYRMGIVGADLDRMAAAHRAARDAIKAVDDAVTVGWTLALVDLQPAPGGEERWQDARRRGQTDWLAVSADDDFVGVQTYSRTVIGPDGNVPPPEGTPTMQTRWEVYPEALGHTVRLAAEQAGVPVLVTENGMATNDDDARIAYTRAALAGLIGAIGDGVDVRGYLHWTLLDNFEWASGYSKTFGLVAVDRESFARTVKPSARWLGRVAAANGSD
jgi:beta-glucosidase